MRLPIVESQDTELHSVLWIFSFFFVQGVYLGAYMCLSMFSITAHLACSVSCQIQEDKEHLVAVMESGLSDKFPRNTK